MRVSNQILQSAPQVTSLTLGLYAGVLGVEHGIFEFQQGNIAPGGRRSTLEPKACARYCCNPFHNHEEGI